ncbi:hypothetical protein FW774_10670 [Pedobacter sp. BS3]|uniref:hypothetical protein n=1 Tax=Pedobacter sp. BS3 TaxID=2567937 RepID=UPI0011EBC37A|nr:hypothetical protein [Pedobacter sp. BS3]TZF83912.1 hypothetical protein FW774_10670 [Pedobacter sp. BS3]
MEKYQRTMTIKNMEIQTKKGSIDIHKPDTATLKQLQNILTYGVMPFKQTFNGADFGVVMQCGEQEVYCLKQQPLEVERKQAEQLFQLQHFMIMDAYCRYIKIGFSGAYLASPYLRQRDNGLWEAGVSHFIFPSDNEKVYSEKSFGKAYDNQFGSGATNMFMAFVDSFKQAFAESKLTMPQYFGIDIRPRSHLKSLAMYFMVVGSDVFCLRTNLREQEDVAWTILASGGIDKVYHLPAFPMTINESDLNEAKGRT